MIEEKLLKVLKVTENNTGCINSHTNWLLLTISFFKTIFI